MVAAKDRVKVYINISEYWLRDAEGNPKSVNSVYEDVKGSPLEIGRNTLRLALDGRLDRGHFENLVKLVTLCSQWSGKQLAVEDLLKIEN
jgi:hypothetical protein